jgi:hypothetical protein
MSILKHLDDTINGYYQKNNNYPDSIIMSKETKKKIFTELKEGSDLSLCWVDKKNNYRGIKIEIKKDIFIELKGV